MADRPSRVSHVALIFIRSFRQIRPHAHSGDDDQSVRHHERLQQVSPVNSRERFSPQAGYSRSTPVVERLL